MGEVVNRLVPVPARRTITARLISPSGWYTDGTGVAEVVTTWTTQANPTTGAWSLTLPPQSSYDADDTWYQISEPGATHAAVVPDGAGPFQLFDIAIVDPSAPACCPPPPAGSLGAQSLDDLDDVSGATAGSVGQVLVKQAGGQWTPATIAGGDAATGQVRLQAVAFEPLSGHRVVTPRTNGAVKYATNDDLTQVHAPLWLTLGAAAAGDLVDLLAFGPVTESSWSWTPGPLWLGANGSLTQVLPASPPAAFLVQVGVATASQRAVIDRQPSIVL